MFYIGFKKKKKNANKTHSTKKRINGHIKVIILFKCMFYNFTVIENMMSFEKNKNEHSPKFQLPSPSVQNFIYSVVRLDVKFFFLDVHVTFIYTTL